MSLLMEALKKAEAEKKKAALEQQNLQTQRTAEHAAAAPSAGDVSPAEAPVPPYTGTFDTSRFSLEPIERTPTPQPPPPPVAEQRAYHYAAARPEDAEDLRRQREVVDLEAEEQYEYGEPISLTEPPTSQSAITHTARFEQTSVLAQSPAAGTPSEEAASAEAEQERSRSGEHIQAAPVRSRQIDTPVAAQAVFIRPPRRRSPFGTLAMLVGGVMVIFVVVLGIWYWKTVFPVRLLPASAIVSATPGSATLPEVQPQANLEQAAVSPAPPAVTEPTPATPPAEVMVESPPPATPAPAETVTPPAAEKTETVAEAAATSAPPSELAPVAAESKKQTPEKPAGRKPRKEKPQIAATDQNQAPASTYDVSPGEIRISTVRGGKSVNPKIQEAYGDYQTADYWHAEQLYREVLDKQPDQRDALLGLAAINHRRGDRAGAAELYGRLLRLNPNDAYAQAAWTALRREQPTVADESDLKLLLQQDPKAAHVHYLLGNVYARQVRWAEAQQAYFDAYKQDPHNTDYVYNLAVSLDHLGERDAALNYYRLALDLADKQAVNFVTGQVLGRIQALSDAGGGGPP